MEDSNLSEFGIVGLGVMASAYARNLYSRGFRVSVWTRSRKEIDNFNEKLNQQPKSSGLVPDSINLTNVKCYMDLDEFVFFIKIIKCLGFKFKDSKNDSYVDYSNLCTSL